MVLPEPVETARLLGRRITTLLPQKAAWQMGLGLLFWSGYGWLARHAFFPVHVLPVTGLDRAVDYSPGPWAWVYLSQFILTGGMPWLIDRRDHLQRYVAAVALLSGVSFLVFFLWPVASPRPALQPVAGLMNWIVVLDGTYNAFPSLHAGFVMLMMGLGWRIFRRSIISLALAVWAVLILFATLATRQHYTWDLVAGLVLGLLADRIAGRGFSRSAPARLETPGGDAP